MAKKSVPTSPKKPIATHKHRDTRPNIPTEELRDFVDPAEGQKKMLYPRDPSLDPQLVWRGKDEQDAAPLEVPAVPIYIQEKIHPQAIVEEFRRDVAKDSGDGVPDLFADFNGLTDFAKKVDFYHWQQHWSNRLILGDSLLVMTSLAEKEALKGRVQMIYFDPPYGIRFGSNWQVSTRKRDVKDGKAEDATRQPEQIRAFRDTWKLGIHSYLAYLRDRLVVARDLLTESGSVFVQIGDENVHLVRSVLDEIFGAENCCSLITVSKTAGQTAELLGGVCDYVLWYAKSRDAVKFRRVLVSKGLEQDVAGVYRWVQEPDGARRKLADAESDKPETLPDGARIFRVDNITSQRPPGDFPVELDGQTYRPGKGYWKSGEVGMARLVRANRVLRSGAFLAYKRFLEDFPAQEVGNLWTDTGTGSFTDEKIYVVQTGTKIIQRCLLMTTDPGDLVLDPTCGSGTTAYVAEQWGRRWITVDSSRVALTLARTRLMAARFPYYHLLDSPDGARLEAEQAGRVSTAVPVPVGGDLRKGFVYRRVPHVTLKAIANNEEIDALDAEWQPKIEAALAKLNSAASTRWHPWEVPRSLSPELEKRKAKIEKPLAEFWRLRRERQQEIDASIARRAETEVLYDQPLEDAKRIRVTGPFTVESLSPHRTISVEEKKALAERGRDGVTIRTLGPDSFGNLILENLRTAGVQNTKKKERLKFDSLEPFAGEWLHGEGRYTETDGTAKRAAICIGPEHGTVGPELVKEAAKEAVRGVGFDLLLVCGFAFDPHISEEMKRYGKLTVLPVRMNPDLAMGELLKKTGAGNLFMVFGEPDVKLTTSKDGSVTIELLGLDVYDPTTGEIRSSATDDIACWFLDTDYNGESFFVRHAYFTGADEPYEKLKRALRAEVDESAWSALYSTISRPFPKPKSGKVAVKVINHYGDEVLKVFEV